MSNYVIYHNPKCSKSRAALSILHTNNLDYSIFLYLDEPLEFKLLKSLIERIGIPPRKLLRKDEDDYMANNLDNSSISDECIIKCMVRHPKLIQRPIIDNGTNAIIGRPPECIVQFLSGKILK